MSHTPLISVVTIAWNAADIIGVTARSIREQTFSDIEHIVIDGASSDSTVEIARAEGREDIRIFSEPDAGIYDAMNKGLRAAEGEFVIFMNAGDSFHLPDVLERMAEYCTDDYDIIYGDTVIVDDSRKIIAPRHHSAPRVLDFDSYKKGMLVCHQAFLVRKSITTEYDLRYRFSSDYDWCLKCIKATSPQKCVNMDMIVADYLTAGTTDRNKLKSLRERFRIMCSNYGYVATIISHFRLFSRLLGRKISRNT